MRISTFQCVDWDGRINIDQLKRHGIASFKLLGISFHGQSIGIIIIAIY